MTTFMIELVITDNRFVNPAHLGDNITRKMILKGSADNDSLAMAEAETICGQFDIPVFHIEKVGRKYKTWTRTHTLNKELHYSSVLVATFKSEK